MVILSNPSSTRILLYLLATSPLSSKAYNIDVSLCVGLFISTMIDLSRGFAVQVLTKGIRTSFVDPKSPANLTCSLTNGKDSIESSGYGVLLFNSSWFLVKCKHKYAVPSLMDMAYRLSE
ncbi:hypothetical protein Tco_1107785 [Tanacetum coccineum]